MKKLKVMLLLTAFVMNAAGQKNIREQVVVFTDRSLYITGESIQFSALISPDAGSKILYCEILAQKGSAVAGGKFYVDNSVSSGSLAIPSDLVTGIYFFRAYTKLMRNDGPGSYSYLQIAVINPYLNEILGTSIKTAEGIPGKKLPAFVEIITDKKLAGAGDSIHVLLKDTYPRHSFRNISVAVVPASLPWYSFMNLSQARPESQDFEPETDGLAVTGIVREITDGKPAKDIVVNLSVLGKGRDFMASKTDPSGHFSFTLRGYHGYHDLFLCTTKDSFDRKIQIDNDYCTTPVTLPSPYLSLTEAERRAAYRMALNVQVDSLFRIKTASDTTAGNGIEDAYFYGTPDETIAIDSYVQMPALEDYFNELPTLVKIRKSGGQKVFRILGTRAGLDEFVPLVMADLVALNDPDKILAVSPQDLDRIEVINSFYVKGDEVYGGIVNFISKRGDFAGIDLSSTGIFVRYGFPPEKAGEMNNNGQQLRPDARNTIMWIPHLSLATQPAISFTAPPTPGKYLITVKGVTSEGIEFISTALFDVK